MFGANFFVLKADVLQSWKESQRGGGITGIQMKFAKTTDFYQFYIVLNPKIPEFFSENPNFDIVERQPWVQKNEFYVILSNNHFYLSKLT